MVEHLVYIQEAWVQSPVWPNILGYNATAEVHILQQVRSKKDKGTLEEVKAASDQATHDSVVGALKHAEMRVSQPNIRGSIN